MFHKTRYKQTGHKENLHAGVSRGTPPRPRHAEHNARPASGWGTAGTSFEGQNYTAGRQLCSFATGRESARQTVLVSRRLRTWGIRPQGFQGPAAAPGSAEA
jgi:hypothetical protein